MAWFHGRTCHIAAAVSLFVALTWRAEAAQLTISWNNNAPDATGSSVERSDSGADFAEVAMTGPGVTAYVDSSVVSGTDYCYRVRAFDATTYSDYSNTACAVTAQAFGLTVVKMGTGTGAVLSEPSGVICGATCSATYAGGTAVTLTATPSTGSTFGGWSGGGCSGTGTCALTVNATTTVTATFDSAPPPPPTTTTTAATLAVAVSGKGVVASAPAGISCGKTCTATYASGTAVSLTATPGSGFNFAGWSGACTGTGPCTLSMTADTTVSAVFRNAKR